MKLLTPKEEEIMGFLWSNGPLFVRQMLEFYNEPRPHFNTVSTFVRILEAKGFVGHKAIGNSHQYYALISEDEFRQKTLKGIVSKYFNNSYVGVVSSLVKEEEISIDELKELIRQVEDQHQQG